MSNKIVKTYDPKKKKWVFVGTINGNIFFRKVDSKKEYMKIEHGYGLQEDVVEELYKDKIDRIIIEDENGNVYSSSLLLWFGKSPKDYGNGKQIFVSLKEMQDNSINQLTLF